MFRITVYQENAEPLVLESEGHETIHRFLASKGFYFDAPCGGRGHCFKCAVRLTPDGEDVLACQTIIDRDLNIYPPGRTHAQPGGAMEIAGASEDVRDIRERTARAAAQAASGRRALPDDRKSNHPEGSPGDDSRLGVAVDIGTTTVVAHLHDLASGERLATVAEINAQCTCGADVVRRIEYSAQYGHETLTWHIREQLAGMIIALCGKTGANTRDIGYVVIAGNTIMQHFAADYSPAGMGTVPFEPISLFGGEFSGWEGLPASESAKVYFAPCVSSYVGGDITAGILACDLENTPETTLFVDVGTNGEITVKRGDKYLCCATAAGPAFEGAEIECGTAAVTGAVSKVKWGENGLEYTVIGGAAPSGICGSGLIDALAVLLDTGAVDETGRMLAADEISHPISAHIGEVKDKPAFFISRERGVYVSAADIRKLQLAKSAIAAGIQTLLHTAKAAAGDIKSFILAGGFGSYMDKESAARIGLFPPELLPVTRVAGNTAGEGAALALCSPDARAALAEIIKKCEYIELSSNPVFNDEFVESMMFE